MNNLDYRTQQNIDKQAAQKLDAAIHALKTVIPNEVISILFDRDLGTTSITRDHATWRPKVHLSSVADVRLFCENAKLAKQKHGGEYFEYGGVSDDVYYFCLLEPDIVKELGMELEEGADPNGTDL